MRLCEAPFAVRVVRRRSGDAAIVYRRALDESHRERLLRVATIGPLPYQAGGPLLREAARAGGAQNGRLNGGAFRPLDADWGARVACYALVASGLRDPERLHRAAESLRRADGAEAAWWLGLMTRPNNERAVRALRILTEAVQ